MLGTLCISVRLPLVGGVECFDGILKHHKSLLLALTNRASTIANNIQYRRLLVRYLVRLDKKNRGTSTKLQRKHKNEIDK